MLEKFLELKQDFYHVLSIHTTTYQFIKTLEQQCRLLLIGGCIRDYLEHQFRVIPRDFDMVLCDSQLDLQKILKQYHLPYRQNKFGGYKVTSGNFHFDIWEIQHTWAFKTNQVKYQEITDLHKTVFLNIDGVFYDVNHATLYDKGFKEALTTKTLDIVLSKNPYTESNLARALHLKYKYNLRFSKRLQHYFTKWLQQFKSKEDGLYRLKTIEMKRYQTSLVDWDAEIRLVKDT